MTGAENIQDMANNMEAKYGKSGTVDELAKQFKTTRATIYRWLKDGTYFFDGKNLIKVVKVIK